MRASHLNKALELKGYFVEEKIARICWNDNDWKKPSGTRGKSQTEGLFEFDNGFGFEEWLFDFETLVDGYKYAFLQPVNTTNHAHAGCRYAIHLYVYDKFKAKNISIAKIASVECLTEKEAKAAYDKLHQSSVIESMVKDVEVVGGNTSPLTTLPPINCFNIRFKPQDVKFISIDDFHSFHELTRYNLYENKHSSKQLFVGFDSEDQLLDDVTEIMNSDVSETERETLMKARVGQGKYRKNVIRVWGNEACAVTLNSVREVLIASHIKAWKDCSDSTERLDGANGILLEATLDKLFDSHLMSLFYKKKNEFEIRFSHSILRKLPKYYKDLAGFTVNIDCMSHDEAARFSSYMKHHNALFQSKCEK